MPVHLKNKYILLSFKEIKYTNKLFSFETWVVRYL